MSEHLLEMAKALIRIKDGAIEVLQEPKLRFCPLRQDLYGLREESSQTVRQVLEEHMKELGMYGPGRVLELDQKPVSFGASEILMDAMTEGLVDCAVAVCEGAGTILVSKPEVLQAVGAHMTGLISTQPIPEIQQGLRDLGCLLLDEEGTIDQVRGFRRAIDVGFKKIAVTVAGEKAKEAEALRDPGHKVQPIVMAVHTTGIREEQASMLADHCDLVWSCASQAVREIVGKRAVLQMGVSIPVFALTAIGKRLILNRALHFTDGLVLHRARLPLLPAGKQPEPLL
jgi:putative methanogenesis marker protein 8